MPKRKRAVEGDDFISSPIWDVIPQDVVVEILEKLPAKSLLRFKAVSKQWRREIESRCFQERHLIHQQKTRDPSILVLEPKLDDNSKASLRTLSMGTSSIFLDNHTDYFVHPRTTSETFGVLTTGSCDGLTCLYSESFTYAINPATRWYRKLPQSIYQRYVEPLESYDWPEMSPHPLMGFGKDVITGIYKIVLLYYSCDFNLNGPADACEIFSFDTNTWRSDVVSSCPYPLVGSQEAPPYAHGSLHWLIKAPTEIQLLSLDLHTETFTIMTNIPVANVHDTTLVTMSTLNNRLSLSEDKGDTKIIWSLNQDNKTWDKTYSLTLTCTEEDYCFLPKPPIRTPFNNGLLLYYASDDEPKLVLHDVRLNSPILSFTASYCMGDAIPYYESLITLP